MNIIEILNEPLDLKECILYALSVLILWYIIWHLIIVKLFSKCKLVSDLMQEGPILAPLGSLLILLFLSFLVILFIGSIQAVFAIGAKILFRLLIFWGGVVVFFIFLIKGFKK